MNHQTYHVIRFTPDPARDEPLNIGLVLLRGEGAEIEIPDEALERAARWCSTLDPSGLVALKTYLESELARRFRHAEDIGADMPGPLPEMMGAVHLSAPRHLDLRDGSAKHWSEVRSYLLDRLVKPPKPITYGGGDSEARKMAKELFPQVRRLFYGARADEPLVGGSGRPYRADIFWETHGARPVVINMVAPSSGWQGLRLVESKAFEFYDIRQAVHGARIAACCRFPQLDPEGIQNQTRVIFGVVDVDVVTPNEIGSYAERMN